ncbi:type IV secretion system DNA-binding domain-containing protein [Micromonospora echinofusca]|uniref:Type IV secretion system DNA-binding domain-containing protein n=1 Tax=Micromonospora echinofusca TaxID=47858 RepID=A0ABS3VRN0_MICEH|nr:type IV secretion system DNA-binding domain-containing protein [Micromonospora echinofusca]MBO4207182.1 type IV secretion system DNA-binding domain-containing protein [Micromonospora echinofusca]
MTARPVWPVQVWQWVVDRPWFGLIVAAVVVGVVFAHDQVLAWRHRRFTAGARWVSIAAPPEVTDSAAAAFWTTMAGVLGVSAWRRRVYGCPHVGWEYTWAGRALTIRVWVPGTVPAGAVEAAVRAAWPAATVTTADAAAPIPAGVGEQVGGAYWPQHTDVLPLRSDHDSDPLRALLAAGAEVRDREHACVQVLARPASARRVRAARRAAATAGTHPHGRPDVATRVVSGVARLAVEPVRWLVEVFASGPVRPRTPGYATRPAERDPVAAVDARAIVDKAVRVPHFEIAVRFVVAADADRTPPGRERTARVRARLVGLAHSIAAAAAAYTGPNRLRRMSMPQPVAAVAGRRLRRGFLATVAELAALAALPQDLAVAGLDRARARAVPAPVRVPSGGRGVKVLGRAQIGRHSVGLPVTDARQHVHVVGKTGVGKSTLLLNMILADIRAGRGTVVVDPRGDLVTDILDRLPASCADRVVIIDPDQENPGCFNPLDDQGDPHLAVDNLVGIFAKIFQGQWGPRMDDTMRVACLTLMRHAKPTLSLVPSLLQDRDFRARFTHGLDDPDGLGGFWLWYDGINEQFRGQVIAPVLARLRAFLLRDFVKSVIGNAHSSFDMGAVLDGGVLLCRLPKGVLGEETSRILGSMIVARVWQAAIARATIPEEQRRDACLYVDECQNFLTLPGSVGDMLAEARGFRLGLVLAHQDLAQLPRDIAAAVSANARTKLFFTVDPADARELSRHTRPELDEHDLAHLDVYTAAARLLVGNRELPAFTFVTNPPVPVVGEATAIRRACATHAPTAGEPPMQQLARTAMRRRMTNRDR